MQGVLRDLDFDQLRTDAEKSEIRRPLHFENKLNCSKSLRCYMNIMSMICRTLKAGKMIKYTNHVLCRMLGY